MAEGQKWGDEGLLLRHFVCYGGLGGVGWERGRLGMGCGKRMTDGWTGTGWNGMEWDKV